jgi:hypothetical protein
MTAKMLRRFLSRLAVFTQGYAIAGTSMRFRRPNHGLWLLWLVGWVSLAAVGCRASNLHAGPQPHAGTTAHDASKPADSLLQPDGGTSPLQPDAAPLDLTGQPRNAKRPDAIRQPDSMADPTADPRVQRALPAVGAPELLGTLVGPGASPALGSASVYGTDLGYSFEHKGALMMLFGDTWSTVDSICKAPSPPSNDDILGSLPLGYTGGVPALDFLAGTDAPTEASRLRVLRGSESLNLGYGQAPVAGFSDGEHAFGIFSRLQPLPCDADWTKADEACPTGDHFFCSTDLGICQPAFNGTSFPWVCDATLQVGCLPGQECVSTSLCVDSTSSQYDQGQLKGEASSVALSTEIAVQRESDPSTFDSLLAWPTSKFSQPSVRTVTTFTGKLEGNDYRPGHGALLIWGRPGFTAEHGREAYLYLMTHALPMPLDGAGALQFAPHYFAGLDPISAEPIWSALQSEAKPLALDGRVDGSPHEELNLVGLSAVSWLGEPINKWVMLYGGDFADYLVLDPSTARTPRAPGAIMIRFADQPWGPFSPPVPHLQPGDAAYAGDPYGPGGFLYHPDCVDSSELACARSDPMRPLDTVLGGCPFTTVDPGRLYAPNIIDNYTQANAEGGIDLIWNVSTWNPYAVKLIKTRIQPASHRAPSQELADARSLERLSDWRSLPVLGDVHRFVQQTSRDRGTTDSSFPLSNNGNRDFNNFVCASKDAHMATDQFTPFRFDLPECQEDYVHGAVIGRFEGSGQLVRTWIGMASLLNAPADDEVLRIYVDDEPKPRVEVPLVDALSGRAGEIFAPPFGAASPRRFAWYYPVAFHQKLIVAIDGLGTYDEYFYHCDVAFNDAPPAAPLPSTRLPERDRAINQLTAVFQPAGALAPLKPAEAMQLAAGATSTSLLTGPATIQELRVRLVESDLPALADVTVSVRWDGAQKPAIDLPLLELFGGGVTAPERSSLALTSFVENDEQVLGLKLPMPFAGSAEWSFRNSGNQPVAFKLLFLGDSTPPDPRSGRLHVQRSEIRGPTGAAEYVAAEAAGRGRMVGACVYVEGHPDPAGGVQYAPLNLLEGDVRVKLDGVLALDGTGTEEYADDVFYFTDAPHANAFAQAWSRVNDTQSLPGRVSLCRWHVLGSELDFRSSLQMTFELGGAGNPSIVELHRTVAYLYLAE